MPDWQLHRDADGGFSLAGGGIDGHAVRARAIIGKARKPMDLGWYFGAGLYAAEVDWMMEEEWAREPEDMLWRRTKCGLLIDAQGIASLRGYMSRSRLG